MNPGDLLLYSDELINVTWSKPIRKNPELSVDTKVIGKLRVGEVVILLSIVEHDSSVWKSPRSLGIVTSDGVCGYVNENYMKVISK